MAKRVREQWRFVKGYEGAYRVSNLGRVNSVSRLVWNGWRWYWLRDRILKMQPDSDGYLQVQLSKEGILKTCKVSRLVANHFIPNPRNKPEVNHDNGMKADNRAANLIWATHQENNAHGCRVLGNHCGERCHWAKLRRAQVSAIRYLHSRGKTDKFLAHQFGVHRVTINRIRNSKIWR